MRTDSGLDDSMLCVRKISYEPTVCGYHRDMGIPHCGCADDQRRAEFA